MPDLSDISKALKFAKDFFSKNKIKDVNLSAELLLSEIVGISRQSLYSHFEDKLTDDQQKQFYEFVKRRADHEPIQYILGYTYFRSLKLFIEPGVLIPRPETELLVETAIKKLKNNYNKILDLCTGSACIACSFANEFSDLKIVATDISDKAIECAKKNVENLSFEEKIELINCNMADKVNDTDFDLLICNPPYVPRDIYNSLDLEVRNFEPKDALLAGYDGMDYIDDIINVAKDKLKANAIVALEFHEDNLYAAKAKFEDEGFSDVKVFNDLAGNSRYLIAFSNLESKIMI